MISPTRIEIRNVRSISHAVIEPTQDGITSLAGAVGVGKSTVLNSMLWALFGEVGGVRGLTSQADMRRAGTPHDQPVEVTVEFTHAGNTYRALRRLRATKNGKETASAELWIDGVKQEQITPTKLTDKIEAITGLSGRAFTGAFFIAQNNLPRLAEGTPAEIQQLFEEQTGLDPLTKKISEATSDARDAQARADALPGSVEDVKAAQSEVDAAQAEGQRVWPALEALQERHERASTNMADTYQAWNDLSRRDRAAQDARVKVASLDGQIESAREQLEQARAETEAHPVQDVAALRQRLGKLRGQRDTVRSLSDRAESAREAARESAQAVEQARQQVPEQPSVDPQQAANTADELGRKVAALQAEYRQYGAQMNKLRELNGTHCPTCTQQLPDPSVIIGPLQDAIARVTQAGKEAAEQHQRAKVAAQAAQTTHQQYQQATQALAHAQGRAQTDQERAERASSEFAGRFAAFRSNLSVGDDADIEQTLAAASELEAQWADQIASAEHAANLAQQVQRLTQGLDGLTRARQEAAGLAEDAPSSDAVDEAHRAYTTAQNTHQQIGQELAQAQREADVLTERVRAAEAERDRQQKLMDVKAEAATDADVARYARDALVRLRRDLVAEYTEQVSATASDLMEQVGAGQHVGVHLDHEFVPSVILPDGSKRRTGVLSGGEKARAALCLRLGITEQIAGHSGGGMIFADEITANQDEETTLHVVELMRSLGRSMLVVAHAPQMQQIANKVVHLSKPDEATGTTLASAEDIALPVVLDTEDTSLETADA